MYAIRTRYHGPTETKGSAINVTALEQAPEGMQQRRMRVSYPYDISGEERIHRFALTRMLHQLRMDYIKAFVDACHDKETALGRAWATSTHYNVENWASGFSGYDEYMHVYAGPNYWHERDGK